MEIIVIKDQARVPVTILRLVGRFNLGNVDEFAKSARQEFESGAHDLLIDLEQVPTITSAGIRALLEIYRLFNQLSLPKSAHVKLVNPTKDVRRVLNLVGFDAYIDIFETRLEALAAF